MKKTLVAISVRERIGTEQHFATDPIEAIGRSPNLLFFFPFVEVLVTKQIIHNDQEIKDEE